MTDDWNIFSRVVGLTLAVIAFFLAVGVFACIRDLCGYVLSVLSERFFPDTMSFYRIEKAIDWTILAFSSVCAGVAFFSVVFVFWLIVDEAGDALLRVWHQLPSWNVVIVLVVIILVCVQVIVVQLRSR